MQVHVFESMTVSLMGGEDEFREACLSGNDSYVVPTQDAGFDYTYVKETVTLEDESQIQPDQTSCW